MQEFLTSFTPASPVEPALICARLLAAALLGWVVAWIYRRTQGPNGADGLSTTLVMLAILIAMVTQVIGDNVARAFSLVGALSIVRFRTVVRDTRDTAFVIFSVVVGMAVGSQNPWVAVLGIAIGGAAAFALSSQDNAREIAAKAKLPCFTLRVRAAAGVDVEAAVGKALNAPATRLIALESTRQGTMLEATYQIEMVPQRAPGLLRALTETDGIQEVRLQAAGETE
jgi:hypothetical protein